LIITSPTTADRLAYGRCRSVAAVAAVLRSLSTGAVPAAARPLSVVAVPALLRSLSTGAVLAAVLLGGCARATAPSADAPQRSFPDLGGQRVMLLPVQGATPTIALPATATAAPSPLSGDMLAALEAELGYWVQQQAPRTRWVLPEAVERAARQSPTLDVRPRDLTVRDFQRARLEMIGDPLYGELRRLSALMDARAALLPIGAVWVPEQDGTGRIHLAAALIDTFGGDVTWYGVVAGTAGPRDDRGVAATTARALARLIPE
jgi:hypothetical protein